MFEKEAEERAERKISNFIPQQWGVSLIRTEQTYETVEGAPHFYLRSLAKMWKEGAEFGYNKANEELEEKISVLLSCKNCPENKDGLICQKEYENKCLAQKIQFIKELQQENAELKGQVEMSYEVYNNNLDYSHHIEEQLTEAKEIIEEFVERANWQGSKCPSFKNIQNKAEQFLKTEVLAVWNQKRTQNDPDKLTDDVMNDWKEMAD